MPVPHHFPALLFLFPLFSALIMRLIIKRNPISANISKIIIIMPYFVNLFLSSINIFSSFICLPSVPQQPPNILSGTISRSFNIDSASSLGSEVFSSFDPSNSSKDKAVVSMYFIASETGVPSARQPSFLA